LGQVGTRPHHKHQVHTLHIDLLKLLFNKLNFLFHNINLLLPILWYVGPPIIQSTALARPETTMEARRRQTMARKRKRMLLPKLYKQKCRVCGDHNLLCDGEQIKECHNCGNAIIRGESQTGSIGMDGSFVGQLVEVYNENANIWQAGKLVNYNFSKDGKDAQSYTLLIEHNGESISGITLPDEYIRFA
jgi:hypothetical protein